mmetsp:Transcript_66039/g.73937  ORF Transcript_66039/g.73937 Transcript_66039/m.73937 type:complete len:238 (-) Transcript_66039:75-788(-)
MNNLLPSVLLFLIISVIFCDVDSLDPSPDVIEQCLNDDSCGANNASFVTFYHYVVDDDDDEENSSNTTNTIGSNNRGVQYTICATNIEANSICKINEVTMVLPEDSNEKCSDLLSTEVTNEVGEYVKFSSGSDCLDRCNNVIFKDWNKDEATAMYELDDDADFGEIGNTIFTATSSIDGKEVCLCNWGNSTPIVGCVTRYTRTHSDANSIFITTSFAAVVAVAVIVASATAIEMAFV